MPAIVASTREVTDKVNGVLQRKHSTVVHLGPPNGEFVHRHELTMARSRDMGCYIHRV